MQVEQVGQLTQLKQLEAPMHDHSTRASTTAEEALQEARVSKLKHKCQDSRSIIRGLSGVEQLIGRGLVLDQMLDQMLDCWFKRRVL